MTRKLSEHRITADLGQLLRRRLVRGTIRDLQRMQDLLSGDDSGLRNTWDEICVQQQMEHSFSWRAYEATIDTIIEHRVSQLQPYELDTLWLLTPEGSDWDCELDEERDSYPVSESDVASYLMDELLGEANDWSNERISDYIYQQYG